MLTLRHTFQTIFFGFWPNHPEEFQKMTDNQAKLYWITGALSLTADTDDCVRQRGR